jgi:TPR repeat protein
MKTISLRFSVTLSCLINLLAVSLPAQQTQIDYFKLLKADNTNTTSLDPTEEKKLDGIRVIKAKAEKGDPNFQYILGHQYYVGWDDPWSEGAWGKNDKVEAAKWFRKAADQGLAIAQLSLGMMYYNGEGMSQDYAEAVKWYRRAAQQGNSSAEFNLALMLKAGNGLPKDML